ncbi:hypothetical protein C1I98_15420 [Spongiactinospora gelatinilytica]|uniref:DUF418 domain-containing protein n=1 Tax=Spongiactinospora gelatinilytica TaxID=2666298 RepID=A0A2W2GAT3_9ACTN|nr:DUF418 domain-containing protein [Spongiactinospora gelatinilytica]PZG45511.1 hypothetical protein C1I98_15420 [Spongiactinospora gelatinilytica]
MSLEDLSSVARAQQAAPPLRRARVGALDVLRGFALCGILPANVAPIANTGDAMRAVTAGQGVDVLGLLVHQRFFPIFSLLFGIGFSLLLDSAGDRVERPRVLLLRRLLVLPVIGLAHLFLLWRGDILTVYALVGLVVLLPSTWLPRWAVAGLGVALVATSLIIQGGHYSLVPGLFLLGSALTRYGVVARIERATWGPVALCAAFAAAAAPFVVAQMSAHDALVFTVAGLLLAGVYVTGVISLLRTRLRPVLSAVFAPLGRMALTNYLSATVIVKVLAPAFGGAAAGWPPERIVLFSFVVLAAQWAISTVWLRKFRYGPVEWLWRWATWLRRPPLARRP